MKFLAVLFLTVATASGTSLRGEDPGRQLEPALLIKDSSCGVLNADGSCCAFAGTVTINVVTNSNTGVRIAKCDADVPNNTGKAVVLRSVDFPGLYCYNIEGGGPSDDWMQTISRSGKSTLTCKYKDN